MIKHVGKNGDRKVVIVFNEVPGEPHMCIAVYPDLLQRQMHDDLMRAIESVEGQNAENLGDALAAKYFQDGTVMLNRLHSENIMKKIQTAAVILTPTPQSHVRLDEMNKILNEMKTGQEAVNRLQDIENSRGMSATGIPRDAQGRRADERGMDVGGPGANVPLPGALNESSSQSDNTLNIDSSYLVLSGENITYDNIELKQHLHKHLSDITCLHRVTDIKFDPNTFQTIL